MGKGDKKTTKGKRFMKSYGKTRLKKFSTPFKADENTKKEKTVKTVTPKTTEVAAEIASKKKVATPKTTAATKKKTSTAKKKTEK